MKWLRRTLGRRRAAAATPTEPPQEEWLREVLEELRTPQVEREFAWGDFDALLAEPGRIQALLAPFTRGEP